MRRLERPMEFSCPHCGSNLCFSKKAGRFFQIGAVVSFLISPAVAFFYSSSTAIFLMAFGFLVLAYGLLSQKLLVKPEAKVMKEVVKDKRSYSMNIAIDHDDYHARQVGRTKDGLQFFLTEPFYFDSKRSTVIEYIALYLFRDDGELFSHKIVELGHRGEFSEEHRTQVYNEILNSLVDASHARIEVKPFTIEKDGIRFGLIPREPDDDEDVLSVELLPGNYMAFFEPWDSGTYDT
ncbi:MAG: hypothetical protein JKY26_01110 [Pseudomonas sp.]|nr:hypothetical protein [Pseudomonas sp.]